jgi:hypothetical protein
MKFSRTAQRPLDDELRHALTSLAFDSDTRNERGRVVQALRSGELSPITLVDALDGGRTGREWLFHSTDDSRYQVFRQEARERIHSPNPQDQLLVQGNLLAVAVAHAPSRGLLWERITEDVPADPARIDLVRSGRWLDAADRLQPELCAHGQVHAFLPLITPIVGAIRSPIGRDLTLGLARKCLSGAALGAQGQVSDRTLSDLRCAFLRLACQSEQKWERAAGACLTLAACGRLPAGAAEDHDHSDFRNEVEIRTPLKYTIHRLDAFESVARLAGFAHAVQTNDLFRRGVERMARHDEPFRQCLIEEMTGLLVNGDGDAAGLLAQVSS